MTRTALVAGASGLVGGHVLRLLLEDRAYERVTVLARRALPLTHRRLVQDVVDFDHLAEHAGFPRVDDVFCCLGTTLRKAGTQDAFRKVDFDYVCALARAASRHRASQFLLTSSIGANPRSRVFYSRVKGEVEDAVSRLPFDGIHVFRPSLLVGRRSDTRTGERVAVVLSRAMAWALVGPLRRYRPIPAPMVAGAMVRVAAAARRGAHVYESEDIRRLSGVDGGRLSEPASPSAR